MNEKQHVLRLVSLCRRNYSWVEIGESLASNRQTTLRAFFPAPSPSDQYRICANGSCRSSATEPRQYLNNQRDTPNHLASRGLLCNRAEQQNPIIFSSTLYWATSFYRVISNVSCFAQHAQQNKKFEKVS